MFWSLVAVYDCVGGWWYVAAEYLRVGWDRCGF